MRYGCVSGKGDHFKLFTLYSSPLGFVTAIRLLRKYGKIGCVPGKSSNWECA